MSTRRLAKILVPCLLSVVAIVSGVTFFACSQTPTPIPVRTFERAQRMDTVCVRLLPDAPPEPRPQVECAPVAPGYSAGQNRLLGVVTQTTRGELAVVDLSGGELRDQSRITPGLNFIPVGGIPTDVAAAPDGKIVFVASAEPNKFAIYGVLSHRMFGDNDGVFPDPDGVASITSWPVCALPQRPGALTVVPRKGAAAPPSADGGVATLPDYELVAVLPGDRTNSAKVVTIDPRPFLRGAPRRIPERDQAGNIVRYVPDPTYDDGQLPKLEPGSLAACPITSAVELQGKEALPGSFRSDVSWPDGVAWVDGGVDLTCDRPTKSAQCGLPPCCGTADGGAADAGACEPVAAVDAGATDLKLGPLEPPHLVAVARDDHTVYIADESLPFIHVVDMTTPNAARELAPYVATSLAEPTRKVTLGDLAISPPTREYKRFLYAIDKSDGSIVVFDATDPATAPRTPVRRPHPELNPFQPEDRISFSTPAVTLTFGRHDFPLSRVRGVNVANARTGVVCNPNPRIDGDPEGRDFGFFYRASSTDPVIEIGPRRLRGVFGFATLANGQIVTIDVDDWDAPCRRPADMSVAASAIAPPQPAGAEGDFDPYHAPQVAVESVTDERIFPLVAPHRMRSARTIKDDAKTGNALPRIDGQPSVLDAQGVGLPLPPAQGSEGTPIMTPLGPATTVVGPSFSLEVPDVHIDQAWSVVFEGEVPGFTKTFGSLQGTDDYQTLTLRGTQANFCSKGIEDWERGRERAAQMTAAMAALPTQPSTTDPGARFASEKLDRRIADYVTFDDELLPSDDPYWQIDQACWEPRFGRGEPRYDICARTFGSVSEEKPDRDFPILEAYDDHLVLGRFFTFTEKDAANKDVPKPYREVIYKDPTNAPYMRLAQCCFHNQTKFKVRTGHSWAVVGQNPGGGGGSGIGFLSHFTPDAGGRCVSSCDPRDALLNARAPLAPPGTPVVSRNSPLAFRNPMFSFAIVAGTKAVKRDTIYSFTSRGQFIPLSIDIAGNTFSVNPQSIRYIEALGQLAVVDAASQGLVIVDLAGVTVARAPYF